MKAEGPALIWCPFGEEESAAETARALLAEGLVACANIMPEMRSLYIWNGESGEARECGVLFKTDAALLDKAVARLSALPPYDEPAIIGWKADASAPGTAAWLGDLAENHG
ncbi:periplasmic divalent cation tolerance protein [Altererythrobacter atlanticus]|uniref:Divalent-cation tolerance protein CutA n=1 Tax=Croceibacterium atlanticum TaxID=1267766 RepID=A0A0F7KVS3_9SPHN|nr:divalent-cation tolerance protein CutA [Croceibacterium atlanticum]AKH43302.1 Divalent-cation tolerance protein CutA [Croceibacterium atlanticum]MBB5731992.1 periplasmic divalent cation tolerance protein [Croceibacterium atlanticum]